MHVPLGFVLLSLTPDSCVATVRLILGVSSRVTLAWKILGVSQYALDEC